MLLRSLLIFLLFLTPSVVLAAPFDWNGFDGLLKAHIKSGSQQGIEANLVDYSALISNQNFNSIAKDLNQYSPNSLKGSEKLAFYINAYNYFALKMVVDNWPVSGIKDIGNLFRPVWKKPAGRINGKTVTLEQIEHAILQTLGEPRIHFAIVCASMSCPDLRSEAYIASRLDQQLDDQTRVFLANKTKGAKIMDGQLYLSEIFNWFEEDFQASGGVYKFIGHYLPELNRFDDFETIDYNWKLNAQN